MQENTVNDGKVLILLAAYNGEKYLLEQLDSIAHQSHTNWELIIRDDASSDNTPNIVRKWISRMGSRNIRFEQTPDTHPKGALANFSALCDLALDSDAQYYCFCDQDDIWHPNKLETMVERLVRTRALYRHNPPLLVHSDLRVVDMNGKTISPSFMQYQGLPDPDAHSLQKLLIQNNVTGCASMFNRALLELVTPIPTIIAIHDWWIALCAEAAGHIEFINKPLINYRQHSRNLVGAKSRSIAKNPLHRHFYKILVSFPGHLEKSILQDQLLLKRLESRSITIDPKRLDEMEKYMKMRTLNYLNRLRFLNRTLNTQREITVFVYLVIITLFYPRKHVPISRLRDSFERIV